MEPSRGREGRGGGGRETIQEREKQPMGSEAGGDAGEMCFIRRQRC